VAARCGWREIASLLVESGASLEIEEAQEKTAYQLALDYKHEVLARFLDGADAKRPERYIFRKVQRALRM